jgi:hypothetical protein
MLVSSFYVPWFYLVSEVTHTSNEVQHVSRQRVEEDGVDGEVAQA